MTISEAVAHWVTRTGYRDIPADLVAIAKRNILDTVGTTLAGSREPVAAMLEAFLQASGGEPQATVIGLGKRSSALEASMANGTLGHVLDYDDLFIPVAGGGGPHISVAVLPAALAAAEREGRSGRDLIEAYVLGCEVAYRVGKAVDPTHYNAGWHTTGTEGIFGAVTAAAKLIGCSEQEMVHAFGIAATEASGLRENFGTLAKPFHAGQAASKGLRAAMLARCGFTSAPTIFEGKNGYCRVFSKQPKAEEITRDLGRFTCLPEVRLKLYPCCAGSHSAIFALTQLIRERRIKPQDVASIEVRGDAQMTVPLIYDKPTNAIEGKFSVQFPLALALIAGRVTLAEFTDERVRAPEYVDLMSRIRLTPVEELRSSDPHSRCAIVEVRMRDGKAVSGRCDYPPGTPQNRIAEADIVGKYRGCASLVLDDTQTNRSVEMLGSLELLDSLDEFTALVGVFTR